MSPSCATLPPVRVWRGDRWVRCLPWQPVCQEKATALVRTPREGFGLGCLSAPSEPVGPCKVG